jgi:hypothetical protein
MHAMLINTIYLFIQTWDVTALPGVHEAMPLKWSQYTITFDANDHPISTRTVGRVPLLCTPTINNIGVSKMLVDGGAGLNVLSVETFELMQVPYERLMPTRPFSGVTKGTMMPIGQVSLPVTFGTRGNYCTELIDFDVAHIDLPYNAILGYPALAKFMAATHHAYNLVKLPGSNGTITVRGDEWAAVSTLEHTYREAAAAYPADEDDVEPLAEPSRKKPQFSSPRTATKKIPLDATDANGSWATITIGGSLPAK